MVVHPEQGRRERVVLHEDEPHLLEDDVLRDGARRAVEPDPRRGILRARHHCRGRRHHH